MNHPTRPPASSAEAGSAYVVALLVLVVLTIAGLSLSFITQTEMQVGANERTLQRVLYDANSGLSATTARALVAADHQPQVYELASPDSPPLLQLKSRVAVSAFYPILDSPCNLCEINDAGAYSDDSYRKIVHAVTAEASRVSGANQNVLARKTLCLMVEVQPWKAIPEAYLPIDDPQQLERLQC